MSTEPLVTSTEIATQKPTAVPVKQPDPIRIVPTAIANDPGPARFHARHWILVLSFLLLVIAPSALGIGYLYTRAADQYHSTVGFSVRSEDSTTSLGVLEGLVGSSASSGARDSDILYEFIRSQQLVHEINEDIDLVAIFNEPENDPLFTAGEKPTIEELHAYWSWMVSVAYDSGTGLIEVEARAFSPENASLIAQAVVNRSTTLINELSSDAKQDAIRFASQDLEEAEARLRDVRRQIRAFRDAEQQIDPTGDIEQLLGVVQVLEGELSKMLISREVLFRQVGKDDSRVLTLDRKIEATKRQIEQERSKIGIGTKSGNDLETGGSLADNVGNFEELVMDREFAEKAYIAVLAAYTEARAEARRKHRYLAAHVGPTAAQKSLFPRRWLLSLVLVFILIVSWLVLVLISFNVRESR